jgi:hypothetical protein
MVHNENETVQHQSHVVGFPLCYHKGTKVITKDARSGTVLDFKWESKLVIFLNGRAHKGFYIITVDFEDYTEEFLRQDLSGPQFSDGGFW